MKNSTKQKRNARKEKSEYDFYNNIIINRLKKENISVKFMKYELFLTYGTSKYKLNYFKDMLDKIVFNNSNYIKYIDKNKDIIKLHMIKPEYLNEKETTPY